LLATGTLIISIEPTFALAALFAEHHSYYIIYNMATSPWESWIYWWNCLVIWPQLLLV